MKRKNISLLGLFGWQNLGNECTLQAILERTRQYEPEANISCICPSPDDVTRDYQIPAFPLNRMPTQEQWYTGRKSPLKLITKVLSRAIAEPVLWLKAYQHAKKTDLLMVPGTGILDDAGMSPFHVPYDLFKWSLVARLAGTRLLYVSVGAGPIFRPLSKWFLTTALSLAHYRSYRDEYSQQYLKDRGFYREQDTVYPDLVFGFSEAKLPRPPAPTGQPPIIGVGLMSYYGAHLTPMRGEETYQAYLDKTVTFVVWLLKQGYTVRLLMGDYSVDSRAFQDVQEILKQRRVDYRPHQLIAEPTHSPEELLCQMAATDIIVATRFHNVIFALVLNKPVISVSYHEKIDVLLQDMGLGRFCQPIDEFNVDTLFEQFDNLLKEQEQVTAQIKHHVAQFREQLTQQYEKIFNN